MAPNVLYQLDVTRISSKDVVVLWWARYVRPTYITDLINPPSLFGIDLGLRMRIGRIILVGYILVMLEGLLA